MEFEDITYFLTQLAKKNFSLILENNHCKLSVICVKFMYKYLAFRYFSTFFNPTPFVFFKDISCLIIKTYFIVCNLYFLVGQQGDWKAEARIFDDATGEEVGCYFVHASTGHPGCTGPECIIGRRRFLRRN